MVFTFIPPPILQNRFQIIDKYEKSLHFQSVSDFFDFRPEKVLIFKKSLHFHSTHNFTNSFLVNKIQPPNIWFQHFFTPSRFSNDQGFKDLRSMQREQKFKDFCITGLFLFVLFQKSVDKNSFAAIANLYLNN